MPTSYKLKIIKKPLSEKIPDIIPRFNILPSDNLYLNLLENSKKIKPGAPLIPIKRKIIKRSEEREFSPIVKKKEYSDDNKDVPSKLDKDLIKQLGLNSDSSDSSSEEYNKKNGRTSDNEYDRRSDRKSDDENEKKSDNRSDHEYDRKNDNRSDHKKDDHRSDDEYEKKSHESPKKEQSEEDMRLEYFRRLRILKREYPSYTFPAYNEFTSGQDLKRIYDDTYHTVTLDTNVEYYKTFLIVGFFGIEYVATKHFGMASFSGFANYQFQKMEKYNRLLIELGEKSYMSFANNLPVEVRLIGLLLFDAAIFFICKFLSNGNNNMIGKIFGDMLSSFGGGPPISQNGPKMRGPIHKPTDIRNMNK